MVTHVIFYFSLFGDLKIEITKHNAIEFDHQ